MKRTKRCGTCRETKPTRQFNRRARSRDGLQPTCRGCNAKASKAYYRRNREKHKQDVKKYTAAYVQRARLFVLEHLLGHPCVDCGKTDPVVLDFDHVRAGKDRDIARLIMRPVSLRRLKAEIDKCEIRCANCHRRKTARQQGWWTLGRIAGA